LVLIHDDADDLNAVRINIPLSRVDSLEKTNMLSFAGLITVTFDPKSSNGASNVASAEYPSPEEVKEDISLLETAPDKQVLQLAVLRKDFDWLNVMTIINKAKTSASESDVDWPGSSVYIDVDPRAGESFRKIRQQSQRFGEVCLICPGIRYVQGDMEYVVFFSFFIASHNVFFSQESPPPSLRCEL
jgi:hypothetical protein